MGTNRRSRRRSAARILNPSIQNKRQKTTLECEEDSIHDNFPLPNSPNPSLDCRQNVCLTTNPATPLHHDDNSTNMSLTSTPVRNPLLTTTDDTGTIFTSAEICSFELMDLLDNAGCPLNTYEQVVCLLRKQEKLGFSYTRAHSRDKLLSLLKQKFHCPSIQSTIISKCEVFSFPFVDMLQDLVDTATDYLHTITPSTCHTTSDELWDCNWMQETFSNPLHMHFNPETDIMLPIILYLDKTGTDVLQRYSLEPLLFTTTALNREARENRRFWRHLGFIPSSKNMEDSLDSLQFYHQCLGAILNGLKSSQLNPPLLRIKRPDGTTVHLKAHLPIMVILGDQLSQDTLCCRKKANAGGAGRVHRSCMCSYLSTDDHEATCAPVPKELINTMIHFSSRSIQDMEDIIEHEDLVTDKTAVKNIQSRTMKYFRKQKQMFNLILSKPFTTHPVLSAFIDMDFGAWKSGVYDATFDDFMHSCEEGLMENIGTTLFDGLVSSEAEKVESLMIPLLMSSRSSVRNAYPRWRLQKGFSRQTLMTMAERVGSVFSIALALHNKEIARIFHEGHERQRTKYCAFPTSDKSSKENVHELYYEQYMHTLTSEECQHTVTHLLRHGFDINILESMDQFQINQLIYHTSSLFEKTSYPHSYPEFQKIDGMYTDLGTKPRIEPRLLKLVYSALDPKKEQILRRHRMIPVDMVIPKHHCKKPKQKGDGSTCAFLGTNIKSLMLLLEYVLCYHSFCKYSSSLPSVMRKDVELIDYSGRSLVAYFSRMIYRGDNTIDSRTTKIHAQRRFGHNFNLLGNVMHGCCEVGERLLKTEAKRISRTAQQRGSITFERQTCSRILDRHLLDKMRVALQRDNCHPRSSSNTRIHTTRKDTFSRQQAHFLIYRDGGRAMACDRKGKQVDPNQSTGCPSKLVCDKLLDINTDPVIEVYNEVILRDGSYVRAWPNYRSEGSWFDFVNVQWEDEDGKVYFLPAQCLAFYKKNDECMALVQSVDLKSEGRVSGYRNSILTSHFKMQCSKNGVPVVYSINCASIDSTLLWFDNEPAIAHLDPSRRSVMIIRPRNEWAYAWYVWNQCLRVKNSNRTITKPMVDLGNGDIIAKVRMEIENCIQKHGRT